MKKLSLVLLLVLFAVGFTMAQRSISGTVTDDGGEPLIGASILVKGTSSGTVTDIDGTYKLNVPDGASMLVISYTGFETQELEIGASSVVDIVLSEGVALDEVVVTALGVERDEKSLGYAVQEVSSDDVLRSGASNTVDALAGKASGIQVTRSSGSVGGGSRITIRGVTSMVGNNQPLIVIDGVRVNNETLQSETATAGTAQSNRLMDLNPEDIENISVLKGAAATALYGTSGATGVILITTKKGTRSQGVQVSFSTQVGVDQITQMIDLQNTYSQGFPGATGYRDPSTGNPFSWGPAMTDLEYATNPEHPNAPGAGAFDENGVYIYDRNGFLVPKGTGNGTPANVYDNVDPFFQTGYNFTNSIAISGGSESASFRLSLSDLRATGVVPNEEYTRQTVKLASTLQANEKVSFSGSMNYTRSDYVRVQQGSNTSGLLLGMLRTPVSFDNTNGFAPEDAVDEVSSYQFVNGRQRNYRGGGGYDNPYWIINNALRDEGVDRAFGNVRGDFKFNRWANLTLNVGFDMTSDIRKQEFEINTRTAPGGRLIHDEFSTRVVDMNLVLSGGDSFNEDLSFNYLAGVNANTYNRHNTFTRGDGLGFLGHIDINNVSTITALEDIARYRQLGFLGQAELSWRNALFLTLSARQDYDSRLYAPGRDIADIGFFYPSGSLAFVFTELMNTNSSFLSFGKLRLSLAKVGAPPPFPFLTYQPETTLEADDVGDGWGDNINFPIAGTGGFNLENTLGNPTLTPEFSTTTEVGLDLRFLQGRLGLDITAYQVKTEDAILNASLPSSTGYTNVWLNSGEMTSRGIEVTLNATPVRTKDFSWDTQVNFTKSESIVDKLAPGLERLFLAGFNSAGTYLVAGNQYGAIFGGAYLREGAGGANDDGLNIPEGQIVINSDPDGAEYGIEAVDPTQRAIGNPNPDFIIGWNNTISYKRFGLNWLIDWREGGDLWNGTAWALSFFGRSQFTADTREEAAAPRPGVKADGTPNDIPIVRDIDYWTSSVGGFGAVGEQFVQDGGWVRLREVGLSYSIPAGGLLKGGGSFGVSGRNLWFTSDYDGIDPETSLNGTGNGQGFDYFNMPSTKSLLFKLNVNF